MIFDCAPELFEFVVLVEFMPDPNETLMFTEAVSVLGEASISTLPSLKVVK